MAKKKFEQNSPSFEIYRLVTYLLGQTTSLRLSIHAVARRERFGGFLHNFPRLDSRDV